jgi:phosphate/sulfate permease
MNYSKNIKRKDIAKRIIISWVIIALISSVLGVVVGYVFGKKNHPKVSDSETETKVYGAYDDKEITEEISLDWKDDGTFSESDISLDADIQKFTYYLCKGYNIDYYLVLAVMEVESDFQTDIVSSTNDYGLMQINQNNHEWLTETIGVDDFLDPYQNIRSGTFILRKLFEKYQKPSLVLMAYNMGESGAARLWKQGIYSTDYTEKVLKYQKELMKGEGK